VIYCTLLKTCLIVNLRISVLRGESSENEYKSRFLERFAENVFSLETCPMNAYTFKTSLRFIWANKHIMLKLFSPWYDFFFFLGGTQVWMPSLMLARQVLFPVSHSPRNFRLLSFRAQLKSGAWKECILFLYFPY
jgi:hypothetical protein